MGATCNNHKALPVEHSSNDESSSSPYTLSSPVTTSLTTPWALPPLNSPHSRSPPPRNNTTVTFKLCNTPCLALDSRRHASLRHARHPQKTDHLNLSSVVQQPMGRFQAANRALTCLSGHSATTITRQLSCTDAACAGSVPRPLAASPAVAAAAQLLLLRPLPTAWHTAAGGQHQHTLWAGNHAWRDWNSCTPRRSFATDNHEALRVV